MWSIFGRRPKLFTCKHHLAYSSLQTLLIANFGVCYIDVLCMVNIPIRLLRMRSSAEQCCCRAVRNSQVIRQGKLHSVLQFSVEILLDGPTDAAFTGADNSLIIPTDTQKNTVYVLAKSTSFDCAEEFAAIVARSDCATCAL